MMTTSFPLNKKIHYVSRVVSLLALWGSVLTGLLTLLILAMLVADLTQGSSGWSHLLAVYLQEAQVDIESFSQVQRLTLFGALCVVLLLVTVSFYFLFRLFQAFKTHGVFSRPAIEFARTLAWLFSATFICLLAFDLMGPLSTHSEAMKAYAGNAYFQDAILLGVIWVGVWVLEYGYELLTENEMTI